MSQQELANLVTAMGWPIDHSQASRLETGRRQITVDQLAILALVLHVDPWSLAKAPGCSVCLDSPPPGFTCNACHATNP